MHRGGTSVTFAARRLTLLKVANMRYAILLLLCFMIGYPNGVAQSTAASQPETVYLLKPARVFDGETAQTHDGWVVLVRGEKIEAAGPAADVRAPAGATVVELPGLTLMPGLI